MPIMKKSLLIATVILASALQVVTADAHKHSAGQLVADKPVDVTVDPVLSPDLDKKTSKDSQELERGNQPDGSGVPHDPTEWKESHLPRVVQYLFAFAWILMLASIPFITPVIDKQVVTHTQIGVGISMLVVLFGGLYLFTNIILFQSVHFKEIRPLTIIECIYFMAQVITTVGYGDIGPAKVRGQVFVGLYVLGALFIISMLISDMMNHMILMAKEYREKLAQQQAAKRTPRTPQTVTVHSLFVPDKPSWRSLLIALAAFATLDVLWIIFFSFHPEEGKSTFQALYMSVITLSSVGLGWFTPVTETGMIFGAFFMIFGTAALANVIGNFTSLMVKMNEWERFRPESYAKALDKLEVETKGTDMVTEEQFFKFALVQMKLVGEAELDNIHQAFEQLSPQQGAVRMVPARSIKETLTLRSEVMKSGR